MNDLLEATQLTRGSGRGTRSRQAALLPRPLGRTTRWIAVLVSGALSFGLVYINHHDGGPVHLEIAALLLSLACAFLVDDAAEESVRSSPFPLLLHRTLRVALVLPALIVIWIGLVWYAHAGWFAKPMSVELAGMIAMTLAIAAAAAPFTPDRRAGVVAGPALIMVVLSLAIVPERWQFLPLTPLGTGWFDDYGRWALALAVASVVFSVASLDRAGRNPLAGWRGKRWSSGSFTRDSRPSAERAPGR